MSESIDLLQHWLVTYAIHSTLLLGTAAVIDWLVVRGRAHWQEVLWKTVLVGAIVSSTLQLASGSSGLASVHLVRTSAAAVSPAVLAAANEKLAPEIALAKTSQEAKALPQVRADDSISDWPSYSAIDRPLWLGIWMLGVAVMLARLQVSAFRLRLMLGHRTPFPARQLPAGLPSWVRVSVCPGLSQPMACGLRQICVPPTLLSLPQGQIDAALAHEWAHLKRADGVWRWLCLVTRAVLFFQPLNLLASRAIASAAEQCSDQLALKNGIQRTDMVDVLARFALGPDQVSGKTRVLSAPPLLASAMLGRPHEVVRRIENLVAGRRRSPISLRWVVSSTLVLSLAAALALPGVSISNSRTRTVVEVENNHGESGQGTMVNFFGLGDGRDKITVQHQGKDARLHFTVQGPFAFDPAEQNLTELDGVLDLTVTEDGITKRLRVKGADNEQDYTFWIDGKEHTYFPEGAAWFSGQLPRLFQLSGLNATARAQRIYDTGGMGALISEVSMVNGDYSRREYLSAVSKHALSQQEISHLLQSATQIISSDKEKRHLLTAVAKHQGSEISWPDYFSASAEIHSDSEQRKALKAVFDAIKVQPEIADLYIDATQAIDSDIEQSLALQALIKQPTFSSQSVLAVLDAASYIESDKEHRMLLEKLLETELVSVSQAKDMVLRATSEISSTSERQKILEAVGQRYGQVFQGLIKLDNGSG